MASGTAAIDAMLDVVLLPVFLRSFNSSDIRVVLFERLASTGSACPQTGPRHLRRKFFCEKNRGRRTSRQTLLVLKLPLALPRDVFPLRRTSAGSRPVGCPWLALARSSGCRRRGSLPYPDFGGSLHTQQTSPLRSPAALFCIPSECVPSTASMWR